MHKELKIAKRVTGQKVCTRSVKVRETRVKYRGVDRELKNPPIQNEVQKVWTGSVEVHRKTA